jgi:hypothetical protein
MFIHSLHFCHRPRIVTFLLLALVLVCGAALAVQSTASVSQLNSPLSADQFGRQFSSILQANDKLLNEAVQEQQLQLRIQQEMKAMLRPEVMVPLFMKNMQQLSANGAKPAKVRDFLKQWQGAHIAALSGGIKGAVTINGAVTAQDVTVLAFDLHGYFVASGQVQTADGSYQIQNLPAGDYYVMTMSKAYVDELYDNIPAPLANKEKWRQAKTVSVQDGATHEGINFDLKSGAVIDGRLFAADGTTPVAAEQAVLVLANAVTGVPVMEQDVAVNDGYYQLLVPYTGKFKLLAKVADFNRTWYPDKADVATATVLTINNLTDVLKNINITLQASATAEQGGSISGMIKGKGQFFGALAGVAFAFDAKDTTLAGLGVGLLGGYTISNLPAGNYIIFGDDYLGNLIEGAGNFVGEFYENAYSVKKSKTVAVQALQETADIDFALERGGSIAGKITTEAGQALDSLMVLAMNAQVLQGTDEPLASSLHIAMCMTDQSGNYKLEGLPSGAYLVRTLSLVTLGIIFESPFIEVKDGKHNNKVVDVFYTNVANPLDYKSATPVTVTAPTAISNINFKLQQAKFIRGSVTDATNSQAVSTALIIAINDSSKNPYPALGQVGSDGTYRLGPMPRGKFKLLALTNLAGKDPYLSEYYDGKRDLPSAGAITVASGDVAGINFTLDRGATIQGFVDLAVGTPLFPAGADTLDGFPVLVYNVSDGAVANYGFVQFNGGYKVERLLPGTYKVLALPMSPWYAATYYGGGATFDDPACKTVTVNYGATQDVTIELNQAKASLSGTIMAGDTKKPLALALVIAYDASGHPVGLGQADINLSDLNPLPTGKYLIPGLRKGTYYVRTFALTANLPVVEQIVEMASGLLGGGGSLDPMSLLSGDLFGNLNFDMALYQDQWYKNLPLGDKLNLEDLVFKVSAFGMANDYDNSIFPVYLPLPYAQSIPKSASPVVVGENAAVGNIDFTLWPTTLGGLTAVTERNGSPVDFQMLTNYPNPFNPETTLSFSLPQPSAMTITIFDGLGRQVRQLANQTFDLGSHSMRWDGHDDQGNLVSSGVYIAVLATPNSRQALKMIMLK